MQVNETGQFVFELSTVDDEAEAKKLCLPGESFKDYLIRFTPLSANYEDGPKIASLTNPTSTVEP